MKPNIKVAKIACGLRHSLLLTTTGNVLGFGDNSSGQLVSKDYEFSCIKKPMKITN